MAAIFSRARITIMTGYYGINLLYATNPKKKREKERERKRKKKENELPPAGHQMFPVRSTRRPPMRASGKGSGTVMSTTEMQKFDLCANTFVPYVHMQARVHART